MSHRILIADDHALIRAGLREILAACPEAPEIDEAASGADVLKIAGAKAYDCILLDIFMPDMNGFEVIWRLKAVRPDARVLVLSMYPEEQYGVRAFRAGASGYLTKNVGREILLEAIRKVCSGQKYITPALAERMSLEIQANREKLPHERLTDRELQILTLIATGKTVSQIARELHLSVKTVSVHRGHILEKMAMKNNAELIRYAVKNFLVY